MCTQANTRPDHRPVPACSWGTSEKTGGHGSQSWGRGARGAGQQKAGTWKCGVLGMIDKRGLGGAKDTWLCHSQVSVQRELTGQGKKEVRASPNVPGQGIQRSRS